MCENTEDGSSGFVEKRYFTFAEPPDELILENGSALGPVTLAYETLGTLNQERSNAILVLHALSGDSHVAGKYSEADPKPGWWDTMVGPGKGIDTDRYFVICSNILGGCMGSTGPGSFNPKTGEPYGLEFPMITISDMVRCQKALIDHLGIRRILAVIGGSLGGMQALEWCVRYPEMVTAAIPIASTTKHSAQAIAFNEAARQSIVADPNWNNGRYYGGIKPNLGLAVARMIGHITYLSDESMTLKFDRHLQDKTEFSYNFDVDFKVESYLRYQGAKFTERFDANSLLYITKAADYFDLKIHRESGPQTESLRQGGARFLVISFTSDWLYPTYQSKAIVKVLKRIGLDVSFCEINAEWGHDAFLINNDNLTVLVKGFLERVYRETSH